MYSHTYEEMEEAGVTFKLETPVWVNENGNQYAKKYTSGCTGIHSLTYPEICFLMDQVGDSTSQKGNEQIKWRFIVCGKEMVKKIESMQKKTWVLLRLTSLSRDPFMCIGIFDGKRKQVIYETGMDIRCKKYGEVSDKYCFKNNSGKSKQYPMGPTWIFKGRKVPCLTRWSLQGSITSKILIAILATLGEVGCLNRSNRQKPLLLVDGHNSHFQLDLLHYVIDPTHKRAVCIGVSYGNALWQVEESSEYNSAYNIALDKAKEGLLENRKKDDTTHHRTIRDILSR